MDKISSSNTLLLTNIIVHASDFAGIVKNFDICKAWSERLNEEFLQQYEEEAKLGLPQSNFIKDLNNRKGRAKNEMGFIKVIVTPLYENLFEFTEKDRKIEIMLKEAKSNNQG
jgi:cAMP-specific phosphodiesterase 4